VLLDTDFSKNLRNLADGRHERRSLLLLLLQLGLQIIEFALLALLVLLLVVQELFLRPWLGRANGQALLLFGVQVFFNDRSLLGIGVIIDHTFQDDFQFY